ncbi:MAG: cupin domain-containing protein [Halioglobus sp.]
MKVRRVVTGYSPEGRSIVINDTREEGTSAILFPGMEIHQLWGADAIPTVPDAGYGPSFVNYYPPTGGFRFGLFTVPPASDVGLTETELLRGRTELQQKWPDMLAVIDADDPRMHRTDTVDFAYVISGEVWLELDDGKMTRLSAGDTVIQNGTRHAWRNLGSEPCRLLFCLVGAQRNSDQKDDNGV